MVVVRGKHAGVLPTSSPSIRRPRVIDAGDGKHQHPTQALLDLYTIWQHKQSFDGLKVGIVGDIGHSRVCGSLVPALKIMGAEVTLIGPGTLMPARPDVLGADHVTADLDAALTELDVVYMLRIQRERLEGAPFPSLREYHQLFGLTKEREKFMKPDAIICHPGPIEPWRRIRQLHGRPSATLGHSGTGLRRHLRAYGCNVSAFGRCRQWP